MRAAELHEEALFKQPPIRDECPICILRLPGMNTGIKYQACCGKIICKGCIHAVRANKVGENRLAKLCPFCRAPEYTSQKEEHERLRKRLAVGDVNAMCAQGSYYDVGCCGFPKKRKKALELFHKAGEMGSAMAYNNIGYAYMHGESGLKVDLEKSMHYYELAAMRGGVQARYNLGCFAAKDKKWGVAIKHFTMAVSLGEDESLNKIRQLFKVGVATKDDYAKALQARQEYLDDIRSHQRDEAAAFNPVGYRYY